MEEEQLGRSYSDFETFNKIKFDEIVCEINSLSQYDQKHDQKHNLEKENTVYISWKGFGLCYTDLANFEPNQRHRIANRFVSGTHPKNYFQVVLDKEKAVSGYVCSYLNSSHGVSNLESVRDQVLTESDLRAIMLPLPPLEVQSEIALVGRKLGDILREIEGLETNISLNPITSKNDLNKLDLVVSAIGELSASDRLKTLIRQDESISLEFKSSLQTPFPDYPPAEIDEKGQQIFRMGKLTFKSKAQIHKHLEEACLKTIVAFLNSRGGTLVIGLTNDKVPAGIEREKFENSDKFLLHLTQIINNRIGNWFEVDSEIIEHEEKKICLVKVQSYIPKKGQTPAHLDKKTVYRRSGPRSDPIEGEELARFIIDRASDNEST
ncbi:putative DNA binding domain-containing protein [Rhodospirillales bacterium]|nr:putative DNA binding domain-containing protein [Rhodospirillales bacterium]